MPFEFIDNSATIDRAARRRIRSHVAIGKNVGKTLVRPSRKKAYGLGVKTTTALIHIPKVVGDAHDSENNEYMVPEIGRQIGDGMSVISFPEPLDFRSKGLALRAFSFISGPRHVPELSNALDEHDMPTSIWVQFMFLDAAYFHCAVAASVTALNNLVMKQEDPTEAMHHLSRAFRLINQRLSKSDTVSDTTIAVVVIMAQHERLQGQYGQSLIHVKGLQRMVELRGGIVELSKNRPNLTQKIFRSDLEYSLHTGSATRFSVWDVIPSSSAIFGLSNNQIRDDQNNRQVHDSWLFKQLSVDLQILTVDIMDLARLVNDTCSGRGPKLNGYKFHDTILLLGYRLIHISPLGGPRPTGRLENTVHLGLMAFVITFLRGLDRKINPIPLLSELFRSAAQERFDNGQEYQEVLLWALFTGRATILKQSDDEWLVPKTARTIHALGMNTWEDLRRTIAKFPWVNAVHDEAGQALWYRSIFQHEPPLELTLE